MATTGDEGMALLWALLPNKAKIKYLLRNVRRDLSGVDRQIRRPRRNAPISTDLNGESIQFRCTDILELIAYRTYEEIVIYQF